MSYATGDLIQLSASDGANGNNFGGSVAISGDGTTIVAGAANTPSGGSFRGQAYVFKLVAGVWTQQAILAASDKVNNDDFGWCVDINYDGSIVVVGAPFHDSGGKINNGQVYVYSGAGWTTETILSPPVLVDDAGQFGYSVSISGDGTVIVGGAPSHPSLGAYGTTFVFSGGGWGTKTTLAASLPYRQNSGNFGQAVAVNYNGTVISIGAPEIGLTPSAQYGNHFIYSGSGWSVETVVTSTHHINPQNYGSAIDINDAGDVVVVSTPQYYGSGGPGIAHVFANSWARQTVLDHHAPTFPLNDRFGSSVAIGGDGERIAVSARNTTAGQTPGIVYLFKKSGTTYVPCTTISAPSPANANLGLPFSVKNLSIDSTSSAIAMGAPQPSGTPAGPGYVFVKLLAFAPCSGGGGGSPANATSMKHEIPL